MTWAQAVGLVLAALGLATFCGLLVGAVIRAGQGPRRPTDDVPDGQLAEAVELTEPQLTYDADAPYDLVIYRAESPKEPS